MVPGLKLKQISGLISNFKLREISELMSGESFQIMTSPKVKSISKLFLVLILASSTKPIPT